MEQNYDISIIIPVYKVERYIGRCLESVAAQACGDIRIECILIDDCSPDGSMRLARQFVEDYTGPIDFRFLAHQQNGGLSEARNTGIKAARGDYLLFVDSDDYLKPECVRLMHRALMEHPQAQAVSSNYYCCKEQKVPFPIERRELVSDRSAMMDMFYNSKLRISVWSKLVSRRFILDNDMFFVKGLLFEDVLWSYQLYSSVNAIMVIPDVTYVYEYNAESIMNTTSQKAYNNAKSLLYIADQLLLQPPLGHYVDLMLFINSFLLRALDLIQQLDHHQELHAQFIEVRKKLFRRSLADGRITLCSFFLLLYPPFSRLLRVGVFRHLYDKQSRLVALLAKSFNWLHRRQ